MKKIYIIVLIPILLVGVFLIVNSNQEKDSDFKAIFEKWDKGAIEATESADIMESLVNYLIENPTISSEDIEDFSPLIKVYEKDGFRIIEYIENPEFYGSSARGSYHIAMCDGGVELIDSNRSTRINNIVKLSDVQYYIYVTDYRFSNITGINIYSIVIDEHSIRQKQAIAKTKMPGFVYNDVNNVLYYDDEHIYYKEISKNGNEVMLEVGKVNFLLILEEDSLYHIHKNN